MKVILVLFAMFLRKSFDLRSKGAFFEVLIDALFLLADHFFEFVFLPDGDSFEERGAAVSKVSFVMLDNGLEGALNVDAILAIAMSFHQILL